MQPKLISRTNLSAAWAEAVVFAVDNPGKEISPLVINLHNLHEQTNVEANSLRNKLDVFLKSQNHNSVLTVANTIFPQSLWLFSKGNRNYFYELYKKNFRRYKKLEPNKNKRGLYFERLTSFGRGPCEGNQLEFIISEYNDNASNRRRSKFQASIFDPDRDHLPDPYLGFPCLDYVNFVPSQKYLTLNAFYAKQLLIEKGYGNYLGLYWLGKFMASQMNLTLTSLNCFIGVEELGGSKITKSAISGLYTEANKILKNN